MNRVAIVVGASGGIGRACVEKLCADKTYSSVLAVSRSVESLSSILSSKLTLANADSSKADMTKVATEALASAKRLGSPEIDIVIATGLLHGASENLSVQPEKRLEALERDAALRVLETNTLMPMLWLQSFAPLFALKRATRVVVLSARVGSIGDNELGGWYSYRSSKAALNMMLKTLSVEFARRYPNVKLIAYHPGTTQSKLSEPFSAKVPPNKLFTPEYSAQCLLNVMREQALDQTLSFVAWDGAKIEW